MVGCEAPNCKCLGGLRSCTGTDGSDCWCQEKDTVCCSSSCKADEKPCATDHSCICIPIAADCCRDCDRDPFYCPFPCQCFEGCRCLSYCGLSRAPYLTNFLAWLFFAIVTAAGAIAIGTLVGVKISKKRAKKQKRSDPMYIEDSGSATQSGLMVNEADLIETQTEMDRRSGKYALLQET